MKRVFIACPLCKTNKSKIVYQTTNYTSLYTNKIKTSISICKNCNFIFTNPRPSLEDIDEYYKYDQNASGIIYGEREKGSLSNKLISQKAEFILSHKLPHNISFLDIGCGQGDLLKYLKNKTDFKLLGLEPYGEVKSGVNNFGVKIIYSSLETECLNIGKFDAISLMSVLEHIYNPAKFLKNINKILKQNGLLFLEVPDSAKPTPFIVEYFGFEHLSYFTLETIKKLLNDNEFYIKSFDKEALRNGVIKVCAINSKKSLNNIKLPIEKKDYYQIIKKYKNQKTKIEKQFSKLINPLIKKWKKSSARIAIYGAGGHTFYLLNLIDITDLIDCLIDSDPKKHGKKFMNWQIYGPSDINSLNLDVIIISSQRFEEEIYKLIKHNKSQKLKIIKCYS
jgi:2-polyprenyl-3-methyl-5-hydroxy-6-metoxy-1,4-benzoquinol methylase